MFVLKKWSKKNAGQEFYVSISPAVVSAPAARDAQLAEVLGFVKKGPVQNEKIGQTTSGKKTSMR